MREPGRMAIPVNVSHFIPLLLKIHTPLVFPPQALLSGLARSRSPSPFHFTHQEQRTLVAEIWHISKYCLACLRGNSRCHLVLQFPDQSSLDLVLRWGTVQAAVEHDHSPGFEAVGTLKLAC
jgi:hypothetical protein